MGIADSAEYIELSLSSDCRCAGSPASRSWSAPLAVAQDLTQNRILSDVLVGLAKAQEPVDPDSALDDDIIRSVRDAVKPQTCPRI